MKLRGGYNLKLAGKPGTSIKSMPAPEKLCVPLNTKRFNFNNIKVASGDKVSIGDVLATDPDNFDLPLLAPADATVSLEPDSGYITLTGISPKTPYPSNGNSDEHAHKDGTGQNKINKLLSLGAWEFFSDAYSGDLPDSQVSPQAVIVSTIALDPFVARGDVQINDEPVNFTRGLEHLQSLLEYQQIYLVMPKQSEELAESVSKQIRGYAWINIIEVDLKYPNDNFTILARGLGLKSSDGPVWSLRTEGVLAIDDALTDSRPCIERVVSVAGPDVAEPTNIRVTTGYPLETIISQFAPSTPSRIINGGIMTGKAIGKNDFAIDSETRGITFLPEHTGREFLGWLRPGFDRSSSGACFGGALMDNLCERLTTAIRGEVRPCISCNFCEEACPAGIMPHLIHKYLYADLIEEADKARVDLCVQCGLCSYVCPSKIELSDQFAKAIEVIDQEKQEALEAAEKARQAELEAQQAAEQAQQEAAEKQD